MEPAPAIAVLDDAIMRMGPPRGSRILVAVSGGPDSVALLTAMVRCAHEPRAGWEILAGHVNHGMRAEEAGDDEDFVRRLAQSLDVPVEVARVDTAGYAKRNGLSIEEAARDLRYASLRRMLAAWKGDVIATGHTLDDQAETFLLRLLRGSGPTGLAAMHSQSGDLRRPFLSIPHEAILRALQEMGQGYRLDSTNTDPRFMRNRIRRELIPLLTLLQPHAVRVIGRTASLLRQESEYLDAETDRALEHLDVRAGPEEVSASLAAWQALHPALRRRLLRRLIRIQSGDLRDIAERHVELLETTLSSASPSELKDRLPHGLQLWVGRRRFSLRFGTLAAPRLASASFIVPGELELPGGRLTGEIQENVSAEEVERLLTVCGPFNALFDADLLGTELTVRARRPGDRMRPIGLGGSRKLQDILTDRHVPVAERDLLPVIQNDRHIVWIVGIVCDERTAVSSTSTRLARLRFTPLRP